MNGKACANLSLAGLLVLILGVPCAFGADDDPKMHDMSPEAKLLPGPPADGSFTPDPVYPQPYDAQAQLDIYGNVIDKTGQRHMNPNPTGVPPVELGIRMYDRGA